MSEKRQINVFNMIGELPDYLVKFLDRYDVKLTEDYSASNDLDIIVAHSVKELDFSKINEQSLVLVFEILPVSDTTKELSVLNVTLLEYPLVQKLAMRFIEDDSSLQVEQEFKDDVKHFESLKITDYHQSGYYCDVASLVSLKEGFNFVSIRLYLTYLMTFLSYLKQANQLELPIDIDLAGDEKSFMIQVHCRAENFQIESIKEALQKESINDPALSLIGGSSQYCHMQDFYYLSSGERLVITALWINNSSTLMEGGQGALFKVFKQFSGSVGRSTFGKNKKVLSGGNAGTADTSAKLPGQGYTEIENTRSSEENTLDMKKIMAGDLNRIIDFVLEENENGIFTYERNVFDRELLGWFLVAYPNQDLILKLSNNNYEYILSNIRDENYLDTLKNDLQQKSPEEMVSRIAVSLKIHLNDQNTVSKINGNRAEAKLDEMNVPDYAERASAKLIENKSTFKSISEIEERVKEFLKNTEGLHEKDVQELTDKIMLESLQDFSEDGERLPADSKVDKALVNKMMKVIQGLKKKVADMELLNNSSDDGGVAAQLLDFKRRVEKSDAIIENKDKIIKELNLKIDGYKNGDDINSSSEEGEGGEHDDQLKKKIRSLESQLELYQERVSVLSNKLDQRGDKGDLLFKSGSGESPLEVSLKNANSPKASQLEDKNRMLEARLIKLENAKNQEIKNLKDQLQKNNQSPSAPLKFEQKILELKRENKRTTDELKAAKLAMKGNEQKLRQSQKQLEIMQKRMKSGAGASSGKSSRASEAKYMHKIKQLEMLSEKARKKAERTESDLAARKSEIAKLKQEMGTLKNNLNEAKRKLGIKAA